MIKTIIFDLAEVYLRGLLGTNEELSKRFGMKIDNKDLHIPELHELFEGKITEEDYWTAMLQKYDWDTDIAELKRIVRNNFKEIRGTRRIIEKLKKHGYKLGLLSVHAREWIEYCEKEFDYHKLFDSVMYSFEIEICKPEKEAYHLMLEKIRSKPNECLFVDDSARNLAAAAELGIQTIQFKSAEQLQNELKRLDIL